MTFVFFMWNTLTEMTELAHVLLRYNIYHSWLRESNINLSLCGVDKLYVHMHGSVTHRPSWKTAHSSLVNTPYGNRSFPLQCWICFHHAASEPHVRDAFLRCVSTGRNSTIGTNSSNDCPREHNALCRSIRTRPGECPMDAERAFPAECQIYGFRT